MWHRMTTATSACSNNIIYVHLTGRQKIRQIFLVKITDYSICQNFAVKHLHHTVYNHIHQHLEYGILGIIRMRIMCVYNENYVEKVKDIARM